MNLDLKDSLFYFFITWTYVLSGVFTTLFSGIKLMYGILPLVLFYLAYKKIYVGSVVVLFFCVAEIIFSSILNSISIANTIIFLRGYLAVFIIFDFIYHYFKSNRINIDFLKKYVYGISIIQPIVIIFQKMIYNYLPLFITSRVQSIDFDFGTFSFKSDPSLGFFLVLSIILLLYRENIFNEWLRYFFIFINSMTVFFIHSKMSQISLIIIFSLFLFYKNYYKINYKIILCSLGVILVSLYIIYSTGILNPVLGRFSAFSNNEISNEYISNFKEGRYSRVGAILYYLNNDLLLIGEGPGKYFDPINNKYTLANTGHVFTYYAEIGLIGLIFSYLLIYVIISKISIGKYLGIVSWPYLNIFFVFILMSITSYVITDIGFILSIIIYTILLKEIKNYNHFFEKCLLLLSPKYQ